MVDIVPQYPDHDIFRMTFLGGGRACMHVLFTHVYSYPDTRLYSGFKFAEMEMSKPRSQVMLLYAKLACMNNRIRAIVDDAYLTHPFRITQYTG